MTDPELIRRAEAAGVAPCYTDWRRERVEVGEDTLAAILDALDTRGEPARRAEHAGRAGRAEEDPPDRGSRAAAGTREGGPPRVPGRRSWGFTVQLYSVR